MTAPIPLPQTKPLAPEAADSALAQQARAGNRAAFGNLYERYRRTVHGILLSHVSYTDAEDLMQSVFLKAIERLADLRNADAFGPWLISIARHAAVDYHRRRKNLVEIESVREMASKENTAHTTDSELALEAIRRLPEAYRETLMLRLVEGMTGPEIAAHTSLTHESVRVNLCRGMKLLRAELERKTAHA